MVTANVTKAKYPLHFRVFQINIKHMLVTPDIQLVANLISYINFCCWLGKFCSISISYVIKSDKMFGLKKLYKPQFQEHIKKGFQKN